MESMFQTELYTLNWWSKSLIKICRLSKFAWREIKCFIKNTKCFVFCNVVNNFVKFMSLIKIKLGLKNETISHYIAIIKMTTVRFASFLRINFVVKNILFWPEHKVWCFLAFIWEIEVKDPVWPCHHQNLGEAFPLYRSTISIKIYLIDFNSSSSVYTYCIFCGQQNCSFYRIPLCQLYCFFITTGFNLRLVFRISQI